MESPHDARSVTGPLAEVKVLDFSQALSGPYAAMLLGDLGASIVKVEPLLGEMLRRSGPFTGDLSLYFFATNRNKRSLAFDLKSSDAPIVIAKLARGADVVIENFRPGVADRLGISFDALATHNPKIVHLSISGYGSHGPKSHWGGFDQVAQGMAGLMSVTGLHEPTRVGIPIADVLAGVYGALGVLAALRRRDVQGVGESVEVSLLSSLVSSLGVIGQDYLATGRIPGLARNDHPVLYPYGVFDAADGKFNVTVADDAMWRRLCHAIGAEDLAQDHRYAANQGRVEFREELRSKLNLVFRTRTKAQWTKHLNESGVPAGPINTLDEVFADEQVQSQGLVTSVQDPIAGLVQMIGSPWQLGGGLDPQHTVPPRLGEHSREVLLEAGFDLAQVDRMIETGSVLNWSGP